MGLPRTSDLAQYRGELQPMTQAESNHPPHGAKAPTYFNEALEDAERLLKYAAEIGIEVDADTRSAVLHARAVYPDGWTEDVAAKLLLALTSLASRVKPVTAASLKAYHSETRPTMHTYLIWAIVLSAVIIPASIATFVTSNISEAIRGDIVRANALVSQSRALPDVMTTTSESSLPGTPGPRPAGP